MTHIAELVKWGNERGAKCPWHGARKSRGRGRAEARDGRVWNGEIG